MLLMCHALVQGLSIIRDLYRTTVSMTRCRAHQLDKVPGTAHMVPKYWSQELGRGGTVLLGPGTPTWVMGVT